MLEVQSMKHLLIALFFSQLSFGAFAEPVVLGTVPLDKNVNVAHFIPENLNSVPEVFISRDEYLLSFNPERKLMNWAAWKIELTDIGHVGRSNAFMPDSDLQAYLNQFNQKALTPEDYHGTCFDKGHQVPSADRDTTLEINKVSFLMSNMIPQTAYLNRVIWEQLEQYTRNLVVKENKKVYIIAGPVFDEDFGKIGPNNDIPIPSKDFKVVVVLDQNQSLDDINSDTQIISVVMPNRLKTGEKPLDNKTELCAESLNLNPPKPVPVPTPVPVTPEPIATSVSPTTPYPEPTAWMPYQVPLEDVEKLTGFKIRPPKASAPANPAANIDQ